jgi:tetratricopeptide (TPR) repeat protein
VKSDSIAFGIAGIAFGLIAGWIIGSQQAPSRQPPAQATASPQPPAAQPDTRAAVLDESKVTALKSVAERDPSNAKPRVDLGNLFFDAERYSDAITWYEAAFKLAPRDVNLSTDLGVSYYYANQPDKALAQFDKSLAIDPKHAKTLLNLGVVRAGGKQDLAGAAKAWEQLVAIDPNSPEAQTAKRFLDAMRSGHGGATKPGA